MNQRICVVIAAYNEGGKIGEVLAQLCTLSHDIIVVDDGSKDNTTSEAARYPVHILRHPFNMGQGAALQTGILYSLMLGSDIIVTFDADGQHCIEDIAVITRPIIEESVDVVFGSRFLGHCENLSHMRKWFLQFMAVFSKRVHGISLTDVNCGIRAFSKRAARGIDIKQNRMAHALEIIGQTAQHGFSYKEVPVTIHYTEYSLNKGQKFGGAFAIFFDWIMRL